MSYWSHNVEKMDEIIEENLPEAWKQRLMAGEISLSDIPTDVQCEAFKKGEADYWSSKADDAYERIRGC